MKILTTFEGIETVVDDEVYEWAKDIKWKVNGNGYVSYRKGTGRVYLHRLICKAPKDFIADHINGNILDNLISNLRVVTFKQNMINSAIRSNNTSGYRGVYFRKDRGRWSAEIKCGKKYALGCYDTAEEAAVAYNKKAKVLYGEYARLNNILK